MIDTHSVIFRNGACLLSRFSHVRLFVIPWTVARQASLSIGFSRQQHQSGLPFPSPGRKALGGIRFRWNPEGGALKVGLMPHQKRHLLPSPSWKDTVGTCLHVWKRALSKNTLNWCLCLGNLKNCEEIHFCVRHPVQYVVFDYGSHTDLRHGKKMVLSQTVKEETRKLWWGGPQAQPWPSESCSVYGEYTSSAE